jgi:NADH dehydrogenase
MKTIVIVGGGAGGLELATRLGHKYGKKKQANIVLVDRNRSHIWKPLLHEIATGTLDISTDGVEYRAHSSAHYYQFQLGTMIGLNQQSKCIKLQALIDEEGEEILPERELMFDTLILAVGSVSNDFGTPGVADNSYFLDSHQQAERFQRALFNKFTRMNHKSSDSELKLAIVGGGATGVELAAELYRVVGLLSTYGMPNMSTKRLKIDLIEAGPRILPALPEKISNAAKRELMKLGVVVKEHVRVTSADKDGFIANEDTRISADLMVWAAGIKAPEFIKQMGVFETNRSGQIIVKPTLQSQLDDQIYVIGDCCACKQLDGSWVPPRAQSAHQMASLVYKNIVLSAEGKPVSDYIYKDYGSLVNLSKYSTVGSLMGKLTKGSMFVEGQIAKLIYISLYRMHLIAIHGWIKGVVGMLAHKIGRSVKPKIKLH